MKTWVKVTLGIFAGFAALIALIFWLTGDITKAGDDFFAAAKNDDMDAAYALLSEDFQAGTSKEELKSYLTANSLNNVEETSWSSRSISGNTGELDGTVTTVGGNEISLKLRLINSEGGWQINEIEKASAGFKGSSGDRSLPSVGKQQQLFQDTVTVFAESLADKSMKKLWDRGTADYRQQFSVEDIDQIHRQFFKYADGYLEMSKQTPIIDSAEIYKGNKTIGIRGHYPDKPAPIYFQLFFFYEGADWKFDGLGVKVGSPPK